MKKRRSQRVAEMKPTPSPSAVSGRRTGLRTLRSRDKKDDVETDKTMELEDMETQILTLEEDCETDVSSKFDKRGGRNKNKSRKLNKKDGGKVEDIVAPDDEPVLKENTSEKALENDTTESSASSGFGDQDEKEEKSEDESKSAFLGMAFGLRKSPSSSPTADKKPVDKIKDVSDSEKLDESLDNVDGVDGVGVAAIPDGKAEPPPNPTTPTDTVPSSKADDAETEPGVKSTPVENDSNKSSGGDAPQPPLIPSEEKPVDSPLTSEAPVGKLRSSIADSEGNVLARGYRKGLRHMEEYSQNYICQEINHPVISCFRELTRADISQIVGSSKLKKSFNSLEQSVLYLGLIDLMATANNNPFYGENNNAKLSKNVSGMVQRILLEFKNIIGMWALSGSDQLNARYSLIINYLRALVPLFNKAGFDKEFSSILDCIEKEVTRLKSNHDKLKTMVSSPTTTTSSSLQASDSQDQELRSTLGEIFLNVSLNVKEDVSDDDDEDVAIIKEEQSKIFGKPLKASPTTFGQSKKRVKKIKTMRSLVLPNDPWIVDEKPVKKKTAAGPVEVKTPKSHVPTTMKSLPQPKTLSSVFQSQSSSTSSSKTANKIAKNENKVGPAKRSANEELRNDDETNKKPKLDDSGSPVTRTEKAKTTIKSFFQTATSSKAVASPSSLGTSSTNGASDKPRVAVNAFAIMMNRSREIAQQKKLAAAPHLTTLKVAKA